MNYNPDEYYNRSEVSNSDLTALKNLLHPKMQFGNREAAFRFGNLVDAIITDRKRVNYLTRKVDDEQYTDDEFRHAMDMYEALQAEARKDSFLAAVLQRADCQTFMVNSQQQFDYCGFRYALDTRCKWDWFFPDFRFGGDLKTTSAETQKQFDDAIELFDWDRSRAWYMDIAGSHQDFIYAISKRNCRVFKHFIHRDDTLYRRGRDKYNELAFQYWCLFPQS